ncbi:replication initiation and membrane attachment protein, DnaB/DnaD family [Peptoanaerobacter stomatis]|uniref:Replication initiation and membrane attachment protein, DnaB/DnaD family n=1 Tax=Peptoanaerobacter stomatis TaxID=796937 RepID=J5WRM5_9FIRM|nr:DnaD domain protein [Peptoanaerobacter stomatis]EJU23902.1 replication initiation and membrane attachment protein, DnaB/DnaD family [Peptoanaerobacter stomatis]NWO24151.1 DnaD domain protein [Peptostreptococcaceae bacterium oral taxon 081]
MFFLSNTNEAKSYTLIHNVFFEQIMPYLDDKYLKVYMYTYYLANNIDKIGVKNNEDIAKDLNIDYLDVISAFDYLEKLNLIRKHYVENSQSDNYSIEILSLNKYSKKQETTYEMEYISSKNEKLRQMYDKIEEITKVHLNAYDIKKIDTTIKNNDIAYEVVIEAFKFIYYNNKSVNVNEALNTLKLWIREGIYTSKDLDNSLSNINERYATYRKILKYFGEYRLPTKPEMKKMDKWIDEYCFSIEVIEKAIDETLKIKSPNFRYLDAILDKWYELYTRTRKILQKDKKDYTNFKTEIMKLQNTDRKITEDEEKKLSFLYKNYPLDAVFSAIKHMNLQNKTNDIDTLFDFITGDINTGDLQKETTLSFGNISLDDLENIFANQQENMRKTEPKNITKTVKRQTYVNTPTLTGKDLEDAILSNNDLDNF